MACILMIPVTIPLIQNVGLNIMHSKNKYKFRTIVFLFIAIANIMISIPLAKIYGGIGTSIGTAISLIIGQGIIMNIYYQNTIHINIKEFWKEILKMTIPVIICFFIGILVNKLIGNINVIIYALKILIYVAVYGILMWNLGMNLNEKDLFKRMMDTFLKKRRKTC